jgi:hypothetical protein
MRLKVHPESLAGAKIARHAKSAIGSNSPLAKDDLIDPPRRNTNDVGESILAEVERPDVLLEQDLSRVNWVHGPCHHHSLVVVNYLDDFGPCAGPTKTDSRLVIDIDSISACTIASKLLQSITRWNARVGECFRCFKDQELS